jgi:hypothetical protein
VSLRPILSRAGTINAIVPGAQTVNVRVVAPDGTTRNFRGLSTGTAHDLLIE